jgi:predicted transcriptional regulator of viral defense system
MQTIADKIESHGGIILTEELSGSDEYKRLLRSVERGELLRVRHGVYAKPEALFNTMTDIERIVPNGVLCLYTAWQHYQLTTTIPPAFCVAIDTKRKMKMEDGIPIQLYYWKSENLQFGVVEQEISGFNVRITDLERSVCDAVKYRNKIGLDVCSEIIRSYVRKKERSLSRLSEYAKKLRVTNTLNHYLEIAIE